jgi:hypothetical protein
MIAEATVRTIGILQKLPGDRDAGNLLMQASFQKWEITQEMPAEHIMELLPDYSGSRGRTQACLDAKLAAKKAVMLGDMARAGELTAYLIRRDYTEVSFMRFCRNYSLCEGR